MSGFREHICKIEGCAEPHRSKGLCNMHYQRSLKGDAMGPRRTISTDGPCLKEGCDRPRRSRGLCARHYDSALRAAECPVCGGVRKKSSVLCAACFIAAATARVPAEKPCTRCEQILPMSAFRLRKAGHGSARWRSRCKECEMAENRERAQKLRLRDLEADRKRERRRQRPPYHSLRRYAKELGIPWAIIVERYPADNRCEICGRTPQEAHPSGKFRRLTLDHCHETGALRGFLCGHCNTGLGLLGDTPERVQAASRYLLSHYPIPVRTTGRRKGAPPPQDALFDLPAAS